MDRKIETLIAALKLIEQHGDAAYAYADRREASRQADGRQDLVELWKMVKQAILDVRAAA